jgi:endonuclease/exonuclease/phosphatase family metal-dependent hydrolase
MPTMLLVAYNTQYGKGKDERIDLDRTVAAVRDGDIIALQEIERHWQRSADLDQPSEIARRMPKHHWAYGPYFDADASRVAGDGTVENRRRQFGVMTLSRWPILSVRLHTLPKFKTGKVFSMVAGCLETVIAAPGGALRVYNIHLNDVTPAERLAQIAHLFHVLWTAPVEGGIWSGQDTAWQTSNPPPMPESAIVLGDFNTLPGSLEYEAIVGPMDKDFGYGRVDVGHRLVDAWVATGHGEQEGITFPADSPHGKDLPCRIDYIFTTLDIAPRLQRCWIDSATAGSDHQPVWVEMR